MAGKKNNKANWMVSNSAKLDRRTKQHTEFGVSASNSSRDMGRTKVAEKKEKKEKKMNVDNPIKHPLWGSLMIGVPIEILQSQLDFICWKIMISDFPNLFVAFLNGIQNVYS